MRNINDRVKDFMDDQVVYDNPHNIEMLTHADDSVCVATGWPGHEIEGFNLEFIFECDTIAQFTQVFGIRHIKDLDRISPAFLMSLYQQGKAQVYCAVDIPWHHYPLLFLKKNGVIIATDDYSEEHEVLVLLETQQQFMDYTQDCYRLSQVVLGGELELIAPIK